MLQYGKGPFLEASSKGDKRFSPFFIRVGNQSLEDLYQTSKLFSNGKRAKDWKQARWYKQQGYTVTNYEECASLFHKHYVQHIWDNPSLEAIAVRASGISDIFGQEGHLCQATILWDYVNDVKQHNNVLLVTGGRDYDDKKRVFRFLDKVNDKKKIHLLIEGGARGADRLCREWAISRKVRVLTMPAEWDLYGKSAGYRRNSDMLDLLMCYKHRWLAAFPGGKGTAQMVKLATGKHVRILKCNTRAWAC